MCGMCALASMLRHHHKLDTTHLDTAPHSRIVKQVLASVLAIKQDEIKYNSRLALLYTMCGRAASKGFPDPVWSLVKAADLSRFHILSICLDAGPLSYKLSVVDCEVGRVGEYDYNGHNSQELLDMPCSADALNWEVIMVLNSAAGSGNSQLRYAEGFSLGNLGLHLQAHHRNAGAVRCLWENRTRKENRARLVQERGEEEGEIAYKRWKHAWVEAGQGSGH